MTKLRVVLAVVIGTTGLLYTRRAAAETTIRVVDVQKVIDQSTRGRDAKEKVERLARREQIKLKQLVTELQETRKKLQSLSGLLSGEALAKKQEALVEKEKDLSRKIQDRREELVLANREEIGKVIEAIDKAAKEVGEEKGYTILLEADPKVVLYYESSLDVTREIVRELDASS